MRPIVDSRVVELKINGQVCQLAVPAGELLIDTLRERLGLGGARGSCGVGMCGACTVLLDGRAVSSCLLLTRQVIGTPITTIEGMSADGQLHAVQQAYIDHAAFQCAYCTPGFILATAALLSEQPDPDEATIREYLSGNLCRCGSYVNILKAVRACSRNG
jgi:aerobic-type carbon monoxide dehydrogenase small subunit (CoxS/CutS family)